MRVMQAIRLRLAHTFINRDFALFMGGSFISAMGMWFRVVTVSWVAFELTGSVFYLGVLTFAQLAPILFFGLLGGVLADRVDRRRLMLTVSTAVTIANTPPGDTRRGQLAQSGHPAGAGGHTRPVRRRDVPDVASRHQGPGTGPAAACSGRRQLSALQSVTCPGTGVSRRSVEHHRTGGVPGRECRWLARHHSRDLGHPSAQARNEPARVVVGSHRSRPGLCPSRRWTCACSCS